MAANARLLEDKAGYRAPFRLRAGLLPFRLVQLLSLLHAIPSEKIF